MPMPNILARNSGDCPLPYCKIGDENQLCDGSRYSDTIYIYIYIVTKQLVRHKS